MIGNKGSVDLSMLNTGVPSEVPYAVTFTSDTAMTMTPRYTNTSITLQYSIDEGVSWNTVSSGLATSSSTTLSFRGQATGAKRLFTGTTSANEWKITGGTNVVATGNLNYLLCDVMGSEIAPTTLADSCYSYMFRSCTSLTTAPSLPATTLATDCYNGMFMHCTSLTTVPELPATTLTTACYQYMFYNCTSLTTAPVLPATTMVGNCYHSMFYSCTSFKVSATQGGIYQQAWRIPTSGTGTTATGWSNDMLGATGGTFTTTPAINTTYYVENLPV